MDLSVARAAVLLAALVAGATAGCAGPDLTRVRTQYDSGEYEGARETLLELEREDSRDRTLLAMERGVVELTLGRPDQAAATLRRVKDEVGESTLYDHAVWSNLAQARSLFTDDRTLRFEARDYEQLLVYGLLTLAEILNRGGDATAYSLQGLERRLEIQGTIDEDVAAFRSRLEQYRGIHGDNPKEAYKLVALGDFLRGVMLEQHPTRADAARRAFESAFVLAPDYPYAEQDLARVEGRRPREEDLGGTIWVFTMVGRGPFLVEGVLQSPAAAILAIAQQIWSHQADRASLPPLQNIKLPELRFHEGNPPETHVFVDGVPRGVTGTITDVEKTAQAEFEAMHDTIVLRAVLRRIVKITAGELVKEGLEKKKDDRFEWKNLLVDVGTNIAIALEKADLRSWSLLPARIQALHVDVPPGEHEVTIYAGDAGGRIAGPARTVKVNVHPAWNAYVFAVVPTAGSGPPPQSPDVVGGRPQPAEPEPAPAEILEPTP